MKIKSILLILLFIFTLVIMGIYVSSSKTAPENPDSGKDVSQEPDPSPSTPTLEPQLGLPAAVEAKRQAIYTAALTRDYAKLAAEAGTPFSYSYGGPIEGDFAAYLKLAAQDENKSVFDVIPTLLALPYGKQGNYYVWPSVFTKTAEEWTADDIAQMKKLLTDEQIEGYRQMGSYAYYRLGIDQDGKWTYYIAGD